MKSGGGETLSPGRGIQLSSHVGTKNDIIREAASKLGENARFNKNDIEQYLASGGHGMDPTKTAWCAAFVGASLEHAGYKSLSSNVASSYAQYGEPEAPGHYEEGDVAILMRGHRPGEVGGHVGLLTGRKNERGQVEMIAGNTGGMHGARSVGRTWENPERLTIRRPIPNHPNNTLKQSTTPVAVINKTCGGCQVSISH